MIASEGDEAVVEETDRNRPTAGGNASRSLTNPLTGAHL